MIDKQALRPTFAFSVLDYLPDAIIWVFPVVDQNEVIDFEIRYANNSANKITNHPKGPVFGLHILRDGVPSQQSAPANFQHFLHVYQTGEVKEYTFFAHHAGREMETIRRPLDGGVLSTTRDRKAEKEAVAQVARQQHLLDNILHHSSNGISVGEMIRGKDGDIIDIKTILANNAAVKYTGIPKDIYLSKTAAELDPSFLSSAYFRQCIRCMETGEPFITQYYLESIKRWMEVSVSKMDNNRQIYVFTDVTSIKEAQLTIERSEAKLQAIINRTQSGIFTAVPVKNEQGEITDFRFVIVNRALASYLNQEPQAMVGELGSKWFTGYKSNGLFEVFKDTMETGRINRFDFHYNADGINAWIDMMCTLFDDELLVTFTDYTPIKQLQLELQASVEELTRSNNLLEDFAHAASHDMKEPLRKIRTFLDRLKQTMAQRLNESEAKLFERVEVSAERMQILVDDLLEFSYASERPQEMELVDLNEKMKKVLSDLDLTIEEKGAQVKVGQLPVIRGHRRQLEQLFHNLVTNALKYSKPGVTPELTIQSSEVKAGNITAGIHFEDEKKPFYLVQVADNGIGFEQQYAERIFGMFQRLHGKAEYSGTGIGLSIARKVVDNHHGFIWATGEPNQGATFHILFPV